MKINIGRKQYFNFGATTALGANMSTWIRTIFTFRKEVSWQFWPKIFAITWVIMFNTPIIWWERWRYGKRISQTKVKAPIFIIGHQRSGTTYLHYLLGKDSAFAYCSVKESFMPWIFFTMESFLNSMLAKAMPDKRPMDNLKLSADLPTEPEYSLGNMGLASMVPGYYFPRKMYSVFKKYVLFEDGNDKTEWQNNLKYFMQKLTLKYGEKPLVMKSPENLGRVKEILEVFPDAKFIHIYRDPYKVYFSTERLYEITLPMVALQHCEGEVVQDFILKSYKDIFAKYYMDKNLIPPQNITEIKYEDFIGNEMEVLESAYRNLGLTGFENARTFIQNEVDGHRTYKTNTYQPSEKRSKEVYQAWKENFIKLGYSE